MKAPFIVRSVNFPAALVLSTLVVACNPGGKPDKEAGTTTAAAVEAPSVEALEAKAAAGDTVAQRDLAIALMSKASTPKHFQEVAGWLEKAVKSNDPAALYLLGELHEAGSGVPADDAKAAECFRKAAELGHADAQYAFALQCALGKGVAKDREASVKWFTAAAEQGLAMAQFNLAQRFEHGQGVSKQLDQAYKWNLLAARGGIPDAAKAADRIGQSLTSAQRAAMTKAADAWTAKPTTPAAR